MPFKVTMPPGEPTITPLGVSPIPEKAVPPVPTGSAAPTPAAPPRHTSDAMTRLFNARLSDLLEPLKVQSTLLNDTIWLCATEEQAVQVRARGDIPYTPQEVAILKELATAVPPHAFPDRLRLIHAAKKEFAGMLTAYKRPDAKVRLQALLDEWAGLDETRRTQDMVNQLREDILEVFSAHGADADTWFAEWRGKHPEARLC